MHKAATSVACAPPQVEMDVRKLLGLLVVLLHSSGCGAGAFYGFESSSGPSFYGMYGAAGSRSGSQTSFHLPHHYDVEKRLGSTSSSREPLRQVSFVVDLEGIHFQDLITDSLSYKDLNGELSKALARCVETIAARSVLKAAWYHKIQPSSDDSGVQVQGHLDFGSNQEAMARFVSAYSGGASGEKVLGSMMVFRKAQLVSIPSSFTSAIDPGLLPDRQTLLLGQLANFKDSGLRGTSPSPIGCKHNLAAAIMVGDPLQECYGRGACKNGRCNCHEGYAREDCGECDKNHLPIGNRCLRVGNSLWAADLTRAFAGGNFWTLENQAAALTKGSDTLQEVEIPPEHVPFVWALSNGTNVRDTGGTELPSSVLPAASGNGTSRIALEQIINATDRRPGNQRPSPSPGVALGADFAGLEAAESGSLGNAQHTEAVRVPPATTTLMPLASAQPHTAASSLQWSGSQLQASAGSIEFVSPAANSLFTGAAKQLPGFSYSRVEDHATTSLREEEPGQVHRGTDGRASQNGAEESGGWPPSFGTVAVACGGTAAAAIAGFLAMCLIRRWRESGKDDMEE